MPDGHNHGSPLLDTVLTDLPTLTPAAPPTGGCAGLVRISARDGEISDGSGSAPYRNDSRCAWLIAGTPQIELMLTELDVEDGYVVMAYVVMAYVVMAYVVMAYVVMASSIELMLTELDVEDE